MKGASRERHYYSIHFLNVREREREELNKAKRSSKEHANQGECTAFIAVRAQILRKKNWGSLHRNWGCISAQKLRKFGTDFDTVFLHRNQGSLAQILRQYFCIEIEGFGTDFEAVFSAQKSEYFMHRNEGFDSLQGSFFCTGIESLGTIFKVVKWLKIQDKYS